MKTRLMLLAAAAMVFFAACTKEETNNPTPASTGGNGGGSQSAVNTLTIDGVDYPMTVELVGEAGFRCVDANGQRFTLNGGIIDEIPAKPYEVTYDLTQYLPGIHFGFSFRGEGFFSLMYDNVREKVMGSLDDQGYDGESMFSSGTATIRYTDDGLFITFSGTLKNNHSFGYNLALPAQQRPGLAPNTFVYDGRVYQLNSVYSISQDGRGYVDASAIDTTAEGSSLFYIVSDVSATDTFDLTHGGNYFFSVSSYVQDIPGFSQSCHDGDLSGNIGETEYENAGSFSNGTLIIQKDDVAAVFKLTGVLKNGVSVGIYLYMPASEWEQLEW